MVCECIPRPQLRGLTRVIVVILLMLLLMQFDSVRDRLYCAPANSDSRRAAQHVLQQVIYKYTN